MTKKQVKTSDIIVTTLVVAIHRKNENPIFGEGAIKVSLDDESGGPFIILSATHITDEGLRIDFDELEAVTEAARGLINGCKGKGW